VSKKGGVHVAVVGGGITGLAAAHRVLELRGTGSNPVRVEIFEAGDRLGGVIGTSRRDGFVFEQGPDAMITEKPWALDLIQRLGMADQIIGTKPSFI
jgi:oxygen-dependent protoporphyrinogen oxidase